jgi:hypothetical protein
MVVYSVVKNQIDNVQARTVKLHSSVSNMRMNNDCSEDTQHGLLLFCPQAQVSFEHHRASPVKLVSVDGVSDLPHKSLPSNHGGPICFWNRENQIQSAVNP